VRGPANPSPPADNSAGPQAPESPLTSHVLSLFAGHYQAPDAVGGGVTEQKRVAVIGAGIAGLVTATVFGTTPST